MNNKEVKDLLTRAKTIGWEPWGRTRSGGYRMRWPATGTIVTVPAVPGEWRALANVEAEMKRTSGPLRPKPGPGRRKAARTQARRREAAR